MNSINTLADLTALSGLEVLDHLDQEISIPVIAGPQAQGDLLVIPYGMVADTISPRQFAHPTQVGPRGIELLRSAAGGNPHSLVADVEQGFCTWSVAVFREQLTLGAVDTSVVANLIHPEHGATGIAPGRYVIRRQREQSNTLFGRVHLVAD